MTKWIDFHTHRADSHPNVESVYSLSRDEVVSGIVAQNCDQFIVGLHPWWLEEEMRIPEERILELLHHDKCFGLGEIGLDRAVEIDFDQQLFVFEHMMRFAKQHHVNRVVIHCVRAYSDVLQILKQHQPKFKIIFHDFNANADIISKLLAYDCYFSIGKRILDEKSTLVQSLKSIPVQRIFFETDDQSDVSIEEVYQQASRVLGVTSTELARQVAENFSKI